MSKEIPTLDMPKDDDDIDSRPRSHREIPQGKETIFKIVPLEWNNVPKIVYEAIACIVTEFDNNQLRQKSTNDDFTRNFRDIRQAIQMAERVAQDDNSKTVQQIDAQRKQLQDKITKLNGDVADKISRVMGSVLDCQTNLNKHHNSLEDHDNKFETFKNQMADINTQIEDVMSKMDEEMKKAQSENEAKFKKINKNFDLKEIVGSDMTFDSQASVNESADSGKLKSFNNFIEFQRYLLKKPFEKIDESETRGKKRLMETENDISIKIKNFNVILAKNTKQMESDMEKQGLEYQLKIKELEGQLQESMQQTNQQIKKHKEELESNDTILSELEEQIKSLEEQIANQQNELKNQNLKFQQQIESLNGEMQQSSAQLKKFIEEEEGGTPEGEDQTEEASALPKRNMKPLNDIQKQEVNKMILDALKAFGPSKPAKPEKPGKKGGAAPKVDKKKFDGDTLGSKETLKNETSKPSVKKENPPPARVSPVTSRISPIAAREKTPKKSTPKNLTPKKLTPKKLTPISNKRHSIIKPAAESDEQIDDDSQATGSPRSIYEKSKRPENLMDPNEALNLHKEAHKHMRDHQINLGRTMIHKKVSVDQRTKEFQEDSPERKTPIGQVRNFVRELKQQQNQILQKSRAHNQSSYQRGTGESLLPDMSVSGHATGSNFYPHNVTSNGVLQKYGQVVPRKKYSDSPSQESPRKVHMPQITNIHQKVTLDDILWNQQNPGIKGTASNMGSVRHAHNTHSANFDVPDLNEPFRYSQLATSQTIINKPIGVSFEGVQLQRIGKNRNVTGSIQY